MEPNKILSADLLDLLFDERNKDYGAYELRRTYQKRIAKSLLITFTITLLALGGTVLARSLKPGREKNFIIHELTLENIKPDEKVPEPLPEPERRPDPEPVQTEQLSTIKIVDNDQVEEPLPTQDDLKIADIGLNDQDGVPPTGIVEDLVPVGEGKGIVDVPRNTEPEDIVHSVVQVEARYLGNWEKFLLRHLDGQVPVENGAPPGRHTVVIKFIVDKEGNVSEITALTHIGYGLEEEAIRVLKKAEKWEPAIQSGYKVKAYRVQRITFEVPEE